MPISLVKTITSDGLHLSGLLSQTDSRSKLILHIHGMAGDPYTNSWYAGFHENFPKSDFAFLSVQHRGTGSITQFAKDPDLYPSYGNALEIFEESVFDIDAWVLFAKNLGYREIYIQAHSLAPSKVVYYMNQKKHDFIMPAMRAFQNTASVSSQYLIKGLILISPVDMYAWPMAREELHNKVLAEAKRMIEDGKGTQLLSEILDNEYVLSANTYVNFFSKDSNCNVFCYTKRDHDWKHVNNIELPVLIIGGTKDYALQVGNTIEGSIEILKSQLTKSPLVKTKIFEGADHSYDGFEKNIVEQVMEFYRG